MELPKAAARPFRIAPMVGADADYALQTLARERFGIDYDDDTLHEIRCADNRWLIAFDRGVVSRGAINRLREKKSFLGIVASWQEENRTLSVRFLILTTPDAPGRIRINVHRLTGEPAFFGFGEVTDDSVAFSVRTVDAPGAFAIVMKGRFLEEGRIELEKAASSLFVRKWRTPRRGSIAAPGRK